MHHEFGNWHWILGFGHWGFGILIAVALVVGLVLLIRTLLK